MESSVGRGHVARHYHTTESIHAKSKKGMIISLYKRQKRFVCTAAISFYEY